LDGHQGPPPKGSHHRSASLLLMRHREVSVHNARGLRELLCTFYALWAQPVEFVTKKIRLRSSLSYFVVQSLTMQSRHSSHDTRTSQSSPETAPDSRLPSSDPHLTPHRTCTHPIDHDSPRTITPLADRGARGERDAASAMVLDRRVQAAPRKDLITDRRLGF
jgi:hypothetical protein